MTTNSEHRRRETDKVDQIHVKYLLDAANKRIDELERIAVEDKDIKRCLAIIIRGLGSSLLLHKPGHGAPGRAMKYLRLHNLQGSPLRVSPENEEGQ